MRGRSTFFVSQRQGRWRWPWLLLSLVVAAIASTAAVLGLFLGLLILDSLGFGWADTASDIVFSDEEPIDTTPLQTATMLIALGVILWPAAIAGSLVHGRSATSLVKPLVPFRWSIVGKCLIVQVALVLIGVAVRLPWLDGVRFNGLELNHLVWLIPMVIATLIQTSGEDVFFKGFLLRQVGAIVPLVWFAPLTISLLFVSLHLGNPDIRAQLWLIAPYFVVSELFIVYLILRTGGMEAALATHWLNNFFIFWIVAEAATQANDLTVFLYDDDPATASGEALAVAIALVGIGIQFVAFVWRKSPFFLDRHGWDPQPMPPPSGGVSSAR